MGPPGDAVETRRVHGASLAGSAGIAVGHARDGPSAALAIRFRHAPAAMTKDDTPLIGQRPAPELVELAERVRAVANRLLRIHEGSAPAVAEACATLEAVDARLAEVATEAEAPRMVEALDVAETRPYYFPGSLAPRVHVAHPWMTGEPTATGRRGRVRFDLVHEGPPGCVHGGTVSWFFDQVFGQHAVATQFGGPTHHLEVVFRKATPVGRVLDYEAKTESQDERKLFLTAELRDDDVLVAEARALFVAPVGGFATKHRAG